MKTLSIDTHPHDPSQDQELYDLLKTAEQQGTGETPPGPGDADKSTVGVNPDQAPDVEADHKGTIDAPWSEPAGEYKGDHALQFSNEVVSQFRQNREQLLDKLFDSKKSSQGAEQQLVGDHLKHMSSGEFESSAPMLKEKSKLQKTSGVKTLAERVRALTGGS